MRAAVDTCTVTGDAALAAHLAAAASDLRDAGGITDLVVVEGTDQSVDVVLAEE
jgi:hypothetical protein